MGSGGFRRVFPARDHDHGACVVEALRRAEEVCARRGARLTALRRSVLERVWESHVPVGAYEILERLNAAGRRSAPITVYRALDFLMAQGLVHRLASRNAYVGCEAPGAPHDAQFLICGGCGVVTEVRDEGIRRAIRSGAARARFEAEGALVEIRGRCPRCAGEEGSDAGRSGA